MGLTGWMGCPELLSMVTMPPIETVKNSSVLGPVMGTRLVSVLGTGLAQGARGRVGKRLTDAVVRIAHRLGARHARKEVVLLIGSGKAGGARNDRHGGLGSNVLTEDRSPLFAREADHARLHRRPLMEVRLVFDHVGAGASGTLELVPGESVLDQGELVRVNCKRTRGGWGCQTSPRCVLTERQGRAPNAFITTSPMRDTGW